MPRIAFYSALIGLFSLGSTPVFAALDPNAGLPCKSKSRSIQRESRGILVAALVGDESRMTFEEYATQEQVQAAMVEEAFQATGTLNCNGMKSTAQLSGAKNVITFSGHAGYNRDCTKRPPGTCKFEQEGHPPIKLKSFVAGYDTDGCNPGEADDDRNFDWAVGILESDSENDFYNIPKNDVRIQDDATLLSVSAGEENFFLGGNHPKNVQICTNKHSDLDAYYPQQTTCDSGLGKSGGGSFVVPKNYKLGQTPLVLSAIHVAESDPSLDGEEYDPYGNFSINVPLKGEFLKALKAAVNGN